VRRRPSRAWPLHIAARVSRAGRAKGGAGVLEPWRDIVTGSRREFTEHGEHDLNGVPGLLARVFSCARTDSTNRLKEQAMAKVFNGRYTADAGRLGDEVVVFIIGMRINKPLKVRQWWDRLLGDAADDDVPQATPR